MSYFLKLLLGIGLSLTDRLKPPSSDLQGDETRGPIASMRTKPRTVVRSLNESRNFPESLLQRRPTSVMCCEISPLKRPSPRAPKRTAQRNCERGAN